MLSRSDIPKVTFQLTAHDERLEVRATAPGGEGKAETSLPPRDLLGQLVERDLTNIPSSVLKSVGKTLYQCLMVKDVARLAADMLEDGRRSGQSVQFELRFDSDQVSLAQYPWEMITNDFDQFLVRDGLVDVTRYINYPQPPSPFDTRLQNTSLLQVVSQPSKFPSTTVIDLTIEKIETLRHATFEQFLHKLLIKRLPLWAVQFDGHGALLAQCRKCDAMNALEVLTCQRCRISLSDAKLISALAFERNGNIDWVPTEEVGSVLFNAKVQLAMLMLLAGETMRLEDRLVFNALAPSLILAGVPAVVGLQYPVLDDFAVSFFNIFYTTLLEQNDVLVALRTARSLNMRGTWYSPVLYLRHQKKDKADEPLKSTYHVRNIDTAVPAQMQVGTDFLVRLWIRRPESKPLTGKELHKELDVPEDVPINTQEVETDIKFEPIQGRKLRRGEVEVQLSSPRCEITPRSIKLFVDEDLDAPAAIFTVRPKQTGPVSLFFSVWQDGGQIVSITHHSIQVIASSSLTQEIIKMGSYAVPVIGNTISSDVHGKSQRATSSGWNSATLREKLNIFLDTELDAFCLDYFPEVFDRFGRGMGMDQKINVLLDYCRRTPKCQLTLLQKLSEKFPDDPQIRAWLDPVSKELSNKFPKDLQIDAETGPARPWPRKYLRDWLPRHLIISVVAIGCIIVLIPAIIFLRPSLSLEKSTPTPSPTTIVTPIPTPTASPIPPPTNPPLVVADFNSCPGGPLMGAAYNPPDSLVEKYIPDSERDDCVARLEYNIANWAAFWIKLNGLDASDNNTLVFYAKGDSTVGFPATFKVEVKRDGNSQVSIFYVSGLTDSWQPFAIPFTDFQPAPGKAPFSEWNNLNELVFTFEANRSGSIGVIYLDSITFEQH